MAESTRAAPRRHPRSRTDAVKHLVTLLARVSPALAARLAIHIWRMTRRFAVPEREQRWLRDAVPNTLRSGRRSVNVWSWGRDGSPVILLVHGWSGRGSQLAACAGEFVTRGYRVIAPDLPGHGESAGRSTDYRECAEVLLQAQAQFGPFQALVAHSFGGVVSCHAMNHGLAVERAVLIGTPSRGDRIFGGYLDWLSPPQTVIDRLMRWIERTYGPSVLDEISPAVAVRQLTIPGLVVHDQEDHDVPVAAAHDIADNWEQAELRVTSGLGHRRILRNPEVVSDLVEFVASGGRESSHATD